MQVVGIFCFAGLLLTPFLEGELTGYCFAVSALALSVLEVLKIVKGEGDWKMLIVEIIGCIFLVIFSLKIRKNRKMQEVESDEIKTDN